MDTFNDFLFEDSESKDEFLLWIEGTVLSELDFLDAKKPFSSQWLLLSEHPSVVLGILM